MFVFPPALKGATDDVQIGSRTAGCRPPIRSMVAETLPLGDDARIYGHQVCLGADISRVLLIDGGDVAPAERIIIIKKKKLRLICDSIEFRTFILQTHSNRRCAARGLPKHEIRRVNLLPALALLDDATVSNHGTLLELGFGIGHVLQGSTHKHFTW